MAAMGRSLWTDMLKMVLSAGWIVLVTLVMQQFATGRFEARSNAELTSRARSIRERVVTYRDGLKGPADTRLMAVRYTAELDNQYLNEIRVQNGVLEVTADTLPDARRVADFVDATVKNIGIDHVGLSSELYEQAGFDITLELLRRGYRQADVLKLLGGNVERVLSAYPRELCSIAGRSSK